MRDGRGWRYEPVRHGLAARGIKTVSPRGLGNVRNISDITPRQWDVVKEDMSWIYEPSELFDWLKSKGFFAKLKTDGDPHLIRGIDRSGIAYRVDLERNEICFMEISDIPGATGDDYWTEDNVPYGHWGTSKSRAYVTSQFVKMDLTGVIEGVANNASWVGHYGDPNKLIDLMISKVGYGDENEEMVYHSRQEAYEAFKGEC